MDMEEPCLAPPEHAGCFQGSPEKVGFRNGQAYHRGGTGSEWVPEGPKSLSSEPLSAQELVQVLPKPVDPPTPSLAMQFPGLMQEEPSTWLLPVMSNCTMQLGHRQKIFLPCAPGGEPICSAYREAREGDRVCTLSQILSPLPPCSQTTGSQHGCEHCLPTTLL